MDFGAWLAERRREAGMTQRQLAKKCGLSAGYLALLEKGTSEAPPPKTFKRLARALGLNREEVRQLYIVARLEKWLKREGYSGIPRTDLLEIAKRIESASQ